MIAFKTGVIQVTATTTATSLYDLINTAKSGKVDYSMLPTAIDHIEIDSEVSIRFTVDGSTPTSSTGLRASNTSGILVYEGVNLKDFMIYGSGVVNVQIGTQGKM